jgi:PilZ domain
LNGINRIIYETELSAPDNHRWGSSMFQLPVSLRMRLVMPRSTAPGVTARESRVWVRYPARTKAHVKTANTDESDLVYGKVLDVSVGGVKLLVNRPFETGSLISLDLPGGEELSAVSVLACVVRTQEQPNGEWILGCEFSQKLGVEDLFSFGFIGAKPGKLGRRGWLRSVCNLKAFYEETVADAGTRHDAQVVDLSADGVVLLVEHEVPNGALLSVELLKRNGERVTSILACVVQIAVLPDGQRVLACNFIRTLGEQHLRALLSGAASDLAAEPPPF